MLAGNEHPMKRNEIHAFGANHFSDTAEISASTEFLQDKVAMCIANTEPEARGRGPKANYCTSLAKLWKKHVV